MNTRSFIRLTLVLGVVAAGIAAGVAFARRVREAVCDVPTDAEFEEPETETGGSRPTPDVDGRKPASSIG